MTLNSIIPNEFILKALQQYRLDAMALSLKGRMKGQALRA